VSALYSQNALKTNARTTATTMERLSTGVRVNSAKDDAAGLAIGQNMSSQIRGLNQAVRNINDGINLVQTAEGGLNSVSNMLQRMRELAVQASNGTYSDVQRGYLNQECQQLQTAISQVVDTSMWNDQKLLDGSFSQPIQIGSDVGTKMDVVIASVNFQSSITDAFVNSRSITIAPDNSLYIAGVASPSVGSEVISSTFGSYLKKYDNYGSSIWTRVLDIPIFNGATGVTASSDGAIYVTGAMTSELGAGISDVYLTKYTSDGIKLWSQTIGSTSGEQSTGIAMGSDGSVFITGYSFGDFDGQTNSGRDDAFLTKFNPDGSKAWTKLFGDADLNDASGIAVGSDDSIYITGETEVGRSGDFQHNIKTFLKKFNPDGTESWTQEIASTDGNTVHGTSVALGPNDEIIICGKTWGNFGGNTTDSHSADAFISKFDSAGQNLWSKFLGGAGWDKAYSVDFSPDGSFYVSGETTSNLEGNTNTNPDTSDAFLARYASSGALMWTKTFGSLGVDQARAVIIGADGSAYITGQFNGSGDHGSTEGIVANADSFIAKYGSDGSNIWMRILSKANGGLLVDISTIEGATNALKSLDSSINSINGTRATLGSYINRLAYAADNVTNISSNATQSRSTIIDADYAIETTNLAKNQIIQQAATAMLAQANTQAQAVMALLKNA